MHANVGGSRAGVSTVKAILNAVRSIRRGGWMLLLAASMAFGIPALDALKLINKASPVETNFHHGGRVDALATWKADGQRVCAQTPQLHRVLQLWVERVQRPAMADPASHPWIILHSVHRSGGFADRVLGVVNALMVAVAAGRGFALDWPSPTDLSQLLDDSALIPWKWPEGLVEFNATLRRMRDHQFLPDMVTDVLESRDALIHFRCRTQRFDQLLAHAEFGARLAAYLPGNSHVPLRDSFSSSFACLFHSLFEPRGQFLAAYGHTLTRLAVERKPLRCAHLRVGKGGNQTWNDSQRFLALDQLGSIAQRFTRFSRRGDDMAHVAGDSSAAIAAFMSYARVSPARLLVPHRNNEEMVHIDKVIMNGAQSLRAFARVILDFVLLAKCDSAILTERSGFGRLGVLLAGPPSRSRMAGKFLLATRAMELKEQRFREGGAANISMFIPFCDYHNNAHDGIYQVKCRP